MPVLPRTEEGHTDPVGTRTQVIAEAAESGAPMDQHRFPSIGAAGGMNEDDEVKSLGRGVTIAPWCSSHWRAAW